MKIKSYDTVYFTANSRHSLQSVRVPRSVQCNKELEWAACIHHILLALRYEIFQCQETFKNRSPTKSS
jgi:hypothetical protein